MNPNELYFLILVCGAFGTLSLSLAIATVHYHGWRKQTASTTTQPDDRNTRRGR